MIPNIDCNTSIVPSDYNFIRPYHYTVIVQHIACTICEMYGYMTIQYNHTVTNGKHFYITQINTMMQHKYTIIEISSFFSLLLCNRGLLTLTLISFSKVRKVEMNRLKTKIHH